MSHNSFENLSDDELLSALLDDELSPQDRTAVENLITQRPGLQARHDSFKRMDDLLRASLNEVHDLPLPVIDPDTIMARRSPWQRYVSAPMAVAASVIMLLSGALMGMIGERVLSQSPDVAQAPVLDQHGGTRPALALARELEARPSGDRATLSLAGGSEQLQFVVTRTWQLEDGRYCREYELAAGASASPREVGVACRENFGEWRIRLRSFPDRTGTLL